MIRRGRHFERISRRLEQYPIVGIIGPRQVGKTTLAREVAREFDGPSIHYDLEDPVDEARLADPMLALREAEGLVVLDEIQRLPEVFPMLRVLADSPGRTCRFLLLGSASPDLLRQSSESLAGRITYYELPPFGYDEVDTAARDDLWVRGGFPLSFLADSDETSALWRRDFIKTYLERDLRELGVSIPSTTLRRFWTMLAHTHGELLNASSLARSFGVSDVTVRRYLDTLVSTFVIRQLPPWHENIKKRQVKSPKVYVADSGLLHTLLGIRNLHELTGHPKLGASYEGHVIQAVATRLGARDDERFFWRTHAGAELDLLIVGSGRKRGFVIKRTTAPRTTRSMHSAIADLGLDSLDVIHAGDHTFEMAEKIRAVAYNRLWTDL